MSHKKRMLLAAVLLLGLTAALAVLHFAARPQVPEGTVLVRAGGDGVCISLRDLPLSRVEGAILNGKGETAEISGQGILLREVLHYAGVTGPGRVTAVADDSYSAVVESGELAGSTVYLLMEEGQGRLVVFGDPNSKRNVSHLTELIVE